MKFNSIRFKFGLFYTFILGVILIIYSAVLYITLYANLYDDFDTQLRSKTQKIINTIDSYLDILGHDEQSFLYTLHCVMGLKGERDQYTCIDPLDALWQRNYRTLGLENDYIHFLNAEGVSIIQSPNVVPPLHDLFLQENNRAQDSAITFHNVRFKDQHLRVITQPYSYKDAIYFIQVGTSLEPVDSLMMKRLFYRLIPSPFILLLGFFLRGIFVLRILKPVREITKTANEITHEDLNRKIETKHVDEEMRYLVDAFNNMIARLEKSFRYVSELSSHMAHELKTPLAIIRGEIEISLSERTYSEEDERVLDIVLEEIKSMLKIIDDLLLLTRLDYRPEMFHLTNINLAEFMRDMYERSTIMASEKNITVSFTSPPEPITIHGEELHLRRLFFNIIDNAIKFTDPQGSVSLTIQRRATHAVVAIADTGIGIAEKDLKCIFDKFYRIYTQDEESKPGSGLGLSIVQTIARVHHGTIDVKSTLGKGTTFTVTLPLI